MGYDRSGTNSFYDYFRQLTEWEPKRAANYGIQHYAWMGINAKEAEDIGFAREVIALLPEFLDRPNVLGMGEVGLHKNTKNECVRCWNSSNWPSNATSNCFSTLPTWPTSSQARE